ncbi:vWA domain-containing protein [Halomicrobium salinisoli]|uniref:vWA domain-containing protein n=1 Tax=Halomicrobium salinisoli TaxID=2878391 RepID=UPI001CEFEB10|nr:VWA domain-containing protein [Halomicrobium salinisoli]
MRSALAVVCVALLTITAGCSGAGGDSGLTGGDAASSGGSASLGASVGGAQDATTFRRNVEEGYVPRPSTMTYEGLYHDYYFDTGESDCDRRFCPSYSQGVAEDPLSNETEHYLTVGLDSGLSAEGFDHEPMDVVVVLDTSGSMDSGFSEYHYDGDESAADRRKITAATDAVASMTDELNGADRLGVVTYDDSASRVQGLARVDELERSGVDQRLRDVRADGGTNLDAGMRTAHAMLDERANESRPARVIYVTDAMPNLGDTDGRSLEGRLQERAGEGVHTTFVGVGVDFNADLTEAVATVRGANYYSVTSPTAFDERMTEGFDYMVTPLAYNLSLQLESDGADVEAVYGSPNDPETGELLHVNTLFPSRTNANGTEGGVMLVELNRTAPDATVTLTASYEDPDGEAHETTREVALTDREAPHFESPGVRKAVALTDYASLVRSWAAHERGGADVEADDAVERRELGQWEQESVDLRVTAPYDERLPRFAEHFRAEARALDGDFEDDLTVLDRLLRETDGEGGAAATTDAGETATPVAD